MAKRKLFNGYMAKEGFKVNIADVEGDGCAQELTFPPEIMDQFVREWQKFQNGTNDVHMLWLRTRTDNFPDLRDNDLSRLMVPVNEQS